MVDRAPVENCSSNPNLITIHDYNYLISKFLSSLHFLFVCFLLLCFHYYLVSHPKLLMSLVEGMSLSILIISQSATHIVYYELHADVPCQVDVNIVGIRLYQWAFRFSVLI
jgi:hypothetical protein